MSGAGGSAERESRQTGIHAALTSVNRYGVGMLKLLGKGEIISAYPAVKVDHKAFVAEAYFKDSDPYVAVENAGASPRRRVTTSDHSYS